jgi:type VI secretion system protein ImpA
VNLEALTRPIAGDNPCGANLEDTQLLASFDAFRIFGLPTPLSGEIDWRAIREKSIEALQQSKDIRPLTHLAVSNLRTTGLETYIETLQAAAGWLKDYWAQVYPLVDEDAILRRNALNGFGDGMAVVDALRRLPIVSNRQLGAYSLRQIDIAGGRLQPAEGEAPTTEDQIRAVFTAATQEELRKLDGTLESGLSAIKAIGETMVEQGGGQQASPDLGGVSALFAKMRLAVKPYLRVEAAAVAGEAGDGGGAAAPGGPIAVGSIRSREDAVRALDVVAEFFRANEPSSPVPLFIDRAKRLVARNFLEVLADMAPDAVSEAKRVSGIKDEE